MTTHTDKDSSERQQRKTSFGIERQFDRLGDWLDTSWAAQKMSPIIERNPHVVLVLTWLLRVVVGTTFIVSGLAKGIDPWGTYYKMQDYLIAMHIPLSEWGNTVLTLCFFLFSLEFLTGISLLLGCFRKAAPIMSALMMLVMLPLTLWIAVADPVEDCGCFGDFIVISNWATFFKNILLALATLWLLRFNRRAGCLISPYLQWLVAVGASIYIVIVGVIGYRQQPMIDFRQYKVGTQLLTDEEQPEYIPTFEFIYEKDGEQKTFAEDDELPDEAEGWKFVRRVEKDFVRNDKGIHTSDTPAGDFRIWNEDATEDMTEYLASNEEQLILFSPDIKELSMATSWKINRLFDIASRQGVDFFAVVSGSPDDIEDWRDLSSGQYQIYTAEDTSIKELVRGNPGLVSLKNGEIVWKSALSAIVLDDDPVDGEDESEENIKIATYPIGMSMTGHQALAYISIILISFLALIIIISVSPLFARGIYAKKNK